MRKFSLFSILFLILFTTPYFIYSQESNDLEKKIEAINIIYKQKMAHINAEKPSINDYLISSIDSGNFQLATLLLIKGASPNYCNSDGITPLICASVNKDTNITKLLIRRGANVNLKNYRGENALQWAVIGRNVDQLKILIDNKSEVNTADIYGISPIFYALGYCFYDLMNYANADYNASFSPDTSYSITYKLIKTLVNSGVDINQVNDKDCTPLLFATFQKDTSLIKILCKLGANPNKTTQEGVSPLIYASQENSYGVVKKLLENGANVNYKLPDGNNALFTAVRANNDSITKLLLLFKANVNEQNDLKLTPLHYAAGYGYPYMTDLLISFDANTNETDLYGNTPLIASVYSGAQNVTDILIDSGADVNLPDEKGNTPLMIASQFNDTVLIKKLFKADANLNSINKNNTDALSIAIENNSFDALKELIELGANTDNSKLSKSYYQLSKELENNEISNFLIDKGLKTKLKPNVSDVIFYSGFSNSKSDFMLDFGGGIHEPITNLLINVGYKYRPFSNRVQVYKDNSFFQFWEKRYSTYLNIQHLHMTKKNIFRGNMGFISGISNEFTWRYYRGVDKGSGVKWVLVPSLGIFYQKGLCTIIGKWEFAKYSKQINESNRFNLQLMFSIPTSMRFVNKKIKWLD